MRINYTAVCKPDGKHVERVEREGKLCDVEV